MTPDQLTERMHAVLDGTATPEETQALDAVLVRDADAAEEFDSWKAMFAAMHAMPMAHPPEGLVASVTARLPAAEKSSAVHQLSSRATVFASGQTRTTSFSNGLRTIFRRSSRSDPTEGYGHMNTNRKIWAGGAVAVVALGVVIFATGRPPKSDDVTGTVMPAERYRAPQSGAEAIKLGEQSTGKPIAAPTEATGVQAAKTEANLSADRAANLSADRSANLSADRAANLSADRSANLSADRAANLSADRSAAKTADRSANLSADRAANLSADRSANLSADRAAAKTADRAANLSADRAASLQADRAAAEKRADKAATN